MTRNRQFVKAAGSRMECHIADWMRDHISEIIDRRTKTRAKDRGNLTGWIAEAHTEAGDDDTAVGIVIHNRYGVADPARQWASP